VASQHPLVHVTERLPHLVMSIGRRMQDLGHIIRRVRVQVMWPERGALANSFAVAAERQ